MTTLWDNVIVLQIDVESHFAGLSLSAWVLTGETIRENSFMK